MDIPSIFHPIVPNRPTVPMRVTVPYHICQITTPRVLNVLLRRLSTTNYGPWNRIIRSTHRSEVGEALEHFRLECICIDIEDSGIEA
jgi:hypothetical protein